MGGDVHRLRELFRNPLTLWLFLSLNRDGRSAAGARHAERGLSWVLLGSAHERFPEPTSVPNALKHL